MSISSAIAPDIDQLCRRLLGRSAQVSERIGSGRNSRVFRVGLSPADRDAPSSVVVKFYRRDPGDTRDRLAAEFGGLQFLWQNNVRVIPCPIVTDIDQYCAIYEYIAGDLPEVRGVSASDIDESVGLLATLKALRGVPGAAALPLASEASFSLRALDAHIVARLNRLRESRVDDDGAMLRRWLDATLEPLLLEVRGWVTSTAARIGIPFDEELTPAARTLSPSDFGFHNAIRRPDGSLAFVDFEYFGWDDPAKTVVDFVLHPGMALSAPHQQRFARGFAAAFSDIPRIVERARIVYPLYGLKWCLILLNDFLPERRVETADVRACQLTKADEMAQQVRRDYRDNPLWL